MGTAAELRKQIESALAGRIPAALSPRPLRSPELVSCGVAEVDVLLGGGLPLGAIVELTPPQQANYGLPPQQANYRRVGGPGIAGDPVGAGSSGRTTLALSTLSGLTRRRHCCAYVDACDALDPLSAAALGVDLRRLLWVRSPEQNFVNRKTKNPRVVHICPPLANVGSKRSATRSDSYQCLERALRATDLLLNAGGWAAVVLDLGELAPAQARRVPLATWYRFRLQAEKSRALLLLLTPIACANSCAAVSLHSEETQAEWRRASENGPALHPSKPTAGLPGTPMLHPSKPTAGLPGTPMLAELHHRVSLSRNRSVDAVPPKPPASHPAFSPQQAKVGGVETWWTSTFTRPG